MSSRLADSHPKNGRLLVPVAAASNASHTTVNMRDWVRGAAILCVAVEAFLVAADLLFAPTGPAPDSNLREIFGAGRVGGVASWFQSTQAILAGLTLLAIAHVERRRGATRRAVLGWPLLALGFVGLGVAERTARGVVSGGVVSSGWLAAMTRTADPIAQLQNDPWLAAGVPLAAGLTLALLLFVWQRMGRSGLRRRLIAGVVCLAAGGAVEAFVVGTPWLAERGGGLVGLERGALSPVAGVAAAALRLLGTTIVWLSFLSHLAAVADGWRVRLVRGGLHEPVANAPSALVAAAPVVPERRVTSTDRRASAPPPTVSRPIPAPAGSRAAPPAGPPPPRPVARPPKSVQVDDDLLDPDPLPPLRAASEPTTGSLPPLA